MGPGAAGRFWEPEKARGAPRGALTAGELGEEGPGE